MQNFLLDIAFVWTCKIGLKCVCKCSLKLSLDLLLYIRNNSNMLSEWTMLFAPIELKLFLFAFQTSWTKKLPITYMSVILWPFCLCNASCVIISISKYLRISTKFDTNFPQFNTSGSFFVLFSIFTIFIDFFSFLGLS